MDLKAFIYQANVFHQRLVPEVHPSFQYKVYYFFLSIWPFYRFSYFPFFRWKGFSFFSIRQDAYGDRDGRSLESFIDEALKHNGLEEMVCQVRFLTMPRSLGYDFNPISFWMCLDAQNLPRAIFCEVHNTFGEAHFYLCMHSDKRPILNDDVLYASKCFHVSPFFDRSGYYRFQFQYEHLRRFKADIALYHEDVMVMKTAIDGDFLPFSYGLLLKYAFLKLPIGLKTMVLIHWQALFLFIRRRRFFKKPAQHSKRLTRSHSKP